MWSGIKYIGDISIQDANVLKEMAETHSKVLEGGVGASTQVLTHYCDSPIVSYDTSQMWIDKTKGFFKEVGVKGDCDFRILDPSVKVEGIYDFVFVDTAREYRLPFAMKAWKVLKAKGILAFHDTRRKRDQHNVTSFLLANYGEVLQIMPNYKNSNITLITKRKNKVGYVNWNQVEGRTRKQIGLD